MNTRRKFLKQSASLPFALSAGSMMSALSGMNAQAADTDGYKALVCVFLFGGMDCHDTVIPYDLASYNDFANVRATLLDAYEAAGITNRRREELLPLTPATNFGGREFALPTDMSALHTLFENGNAAIVGNVGPLLEPTNKAGFDSNMGLFPDRLFSHNDQQSTWMSFAPEGAQYGWGGGFGDMVNTNPGSLASVFSQISVFGNTVFLSGETVSNYQVSTSGVPTITLLDESVTGNLPNNLVNLLEQHFSSEGENRANLFEQDQINLSRVSLEANEALTAALDAAPDLATSFPGGLLGSELSTVAKTISVRNSLGVNRQVFFVGLGGFDTHSDQATTLPGLQSEISEALAAFYAATEEMGIETDVTTFTASDFGRTLVANGDGTDHGWGAHHFVVGGDVFGGDIYGAIPVPQIGHDQDAGNGRLIPSVSVEQFAAPLGSWFGLNNTEIQTVLPGLSSFPDGPLSFI